MTDRWAVLFELGPEVFVKAVVVTQVGTPETLELQDVPDPVIASGEVLIEVRYSGVNYAESLARRGRVPTPPTPFVMGLEVVGIVVEVGADVVGLAPGQIVAAFSSRGHAQFAAVPAAFVVPLDRPMGTVAAVRAIGLPCTGVTARQLLTLMGRLTPGETVFVQGAAGGVGTQLGQQARALGAGRVIGTVGSIDKIAFALAHGYDEVFLREDFAARLAQVTEGRGVDLFLEGVSGAHLETPSELLAPLGRAVYFGDAQFSSEARIALQPLRTTSLTVSGYSLGGLCARAPQHWKPSAEAVADLMAAGAIKDVEATLYAPADAWQAHASLESRQSQGKLGLDWSQL